MTAQPAAYRHNFRTFLFHATFLALAQNFMDVDTVMPAMLFESGGTAMHVGILTAIMLGGSSLTQLFFASYLSGKPYKKRFLLYGINLRVFSLLALGFILLSLQGAESIWVLPSIFVFITLFSLSGAYANISYVDILGKSLDPDRRKNFFSTKQILTGLVFVVGASLARKVLAIDEYPYNFAWMFFTGGGFLFIASFGFWGIKETEPSQKKVKGFKAFVRTLREELKTNDRLKYFLGFVNTQGIIISFLPFILYFAKQELQAQPSDTGNYLLFKVLGTVTVSFLVLLGGRRIKYQGLLWFNYVLSLIIVVMAFWVDSLSAIRYLFILGGISYAVYSISMNGLLLEISTSENRAIYTGFVGAGNLVPALFPLAGAWMVDHLPFSQFLSLFAGILLIAGIFIRKLSVDS